MMLLIIANAWAGPTSRASGSGMGGECAKIKRADGAASSRAMLLHWDEAGAGYIGDENC